MKKAIVFGLLLASVCVAQTVKYRGHTKIRGQVSTSTTNAAPVFCPAGSYFCSGFETGNTSDWLSSNGTMSVTSGAKYAGGYGLDIAFATLGSSDMNYWVRKEFPAGTTHVAIRGYVYHPTQSGVLCGGFKEIYIQGANWPSNYTVIGALKFDSTGGLRILTSSAGDQSHIATQNENGPTIADNTWYAIEVEAQLNTPSVADGFINVWVDGTKSTNLSKANLNIRSDSNNWDVVLVGAQRDPANCATAAPTTGADEHRYWDNVAMKVGTFSCGVNGCLGP